jgi:RHS repeat-associated protein
MNSGVAATPLKKTRLWGTDLSGTPQGAGGVAGLLSESLISNPQSPIYYPTYDGNGNISEYLTATGTTAAHFEYDPFGDTVVNTDSANLFTYRFSTKPRDQETGLYYYGYRYYDSMNGRWPSRDPIEEKGGANLYKFLGNNALSKWDYLGQAWYDDIVNYFKEIPDATRVCYGDTAGDIILSISIVPFEEVATGDVSAIAADFLLSRVPGAKCGIKGAKKIGKAFKKSDGKCYQKVEVEVKKGKVEPNKPNKKCKFVGLTWVGAGAMCTYECEDGQRVFGEAARKGDGSDC